MPSSATNPTLLSRLKAGCASCFPQYAARAHSPFGDDEEHEEWRVMAALAAGCLLFGVLGLLSEAIFHNRPVATGLYLLAYLCGGWDAAGDAWERIRKGQLDVHFLMLAVAVGAGIIGAWREGALLLFLFSASGAMEHFAMGRTKKAIDALFRGAPKTARVLRDGREEQVPVEQLVPGMVVLVTTGEQIPADMEVIKGESACDESNMTGEAIPVAKRPGDTALSGTINLWGVLEGRVLRPASESSLQKIIRLIQNAQNLKAPSQRFTDKFGTGYTWTILSLCTVMFFVWWLVLGLTPFETTDGSASAFYRTMTLLVVASPCALVLSVPSAIQYQRRRPRQDRHPDLGKSHPRRDRCLRGIGGTLPQSRPLPRPPLRASSLPCHPADRSNLGHPRHGSGELRDHTGQGGSGTHRRGDLCHGKPEARPGTRPLCGPGTPTCRKNSRSCRLGGR